jgi:aspartate/methionine/tyrosine aminotransferase
MIIGMFSAFAAFLDEGDEVIVMEPYFDQVLHFGSSDVGKTDTI